MRLTPQQQTSIRAIAAANFGVRAPIWLFGSRLDDSQRGGDVDLYLEAAAPALMDEIRCKVQLQDALGLPVDLVVRPPQCPSVIARHARAQGIQLS